MNKINLNGSSKQSLHDDIIVDLYMQFSSSITQQLSSTNAKMPNCKTEFSKELQLR